MTSASCRRRRTVPSATATALRVLAAAAAAAAFAFSSLAFSSLAPAAAALRVLAVENVPGRSHWNFMSAVLRALTDRGHAVTAFTPFPDGARANYTEVDLSADLPIKVAMDSEVAFRVFARPEVMLPLLVNMSRGFCAAVHGKREMTRILDGAGGGYDVVLAEALASECASYAAARLRVPLVYAIPSPMITYMERSLLGHVPNPAAVSHLMAGRAVPRTFAQRCRNVALLAYSAFAVWREETALRRADPQPYDAAAAAVSPSLVLVNAHHVTEAPRPMPPNVAQVGGIHLRPPGAVPDDILNFIENSPHGVIYFTFGSVVSMSTLPEYIHNAFKEALAKVPQRVLWKYEGEMKDKPKNVMTSKWFPQRDILLHPKVKLFISHGGISGVYEAVDAGVPVLGFPLFYDQPRNIENLVEAGMAISMDLLTMKKDQFLDNVLELINNETYTKNAKIASDRFKDRPMTPAETVVYWTEYVVRHKGAPHLKSHAFNLSWYQYFLLDVIFVSLILLCIILVVIYTIVKSIYKYLKTISCSTKSKSE